MKNGKRSFAEKVKNIAKKGKLKVTRKEHKIVHQRSWGVKRIQKIRKKKAKKKEAKKRLQV